MNEYFTLWSQTEKPGDDPQDGEVVAFGIFEEDVMQQCWVLIEHYPEREDTVQEDALGIKRVMRKNLSGFELRPPSEEAFQEFLSIMLRGDRYTQIPTWQFKLFTPEDSNA